MSVLGSGPSPRREGNANQSRERDSGEIAKNCRGDAYADSNLPQVQNGMCDEPRVRPSRVSYREGNLMSGDLLTDEVHDLSGITISRSLVSTTNMASSFAGAVVLAFWLTW